MICCAMSTTSRLNSEILGNILAYLSVGDRLQDVERLVSALSEVRPPLQPQQGRPHGAGIH